MSLKDIEDSLLFYIKNQDIVYSNKYYYHYCDKFVLESKKMSQKIRRDTQLKIKEYRAKIDRIQK